MTTEQSMPLHGKETSDVHHNITEPLLAGESGAPLLSASNSEDENVADVQQEIEEMVHEHIVPFLVPTVLIAESSSAIAELEESLEEAIVDDEQSCHTCGSIENVQLRENPLTLGYPSPTIEPMCDSCETELLHSLDCRP